MDDRSLIDRIAGLVRPTCAWCGGSLGDSASNDFCCPEHQAAWTAHRNDVAELTGYREAAWVCPGRDEARYNPDDTDDTDEGLSEDEQRELAEAVAIFQAFLNEHHEQMRAIDRRHEFVMGRIKRRGRVLTAIIALALLVFLAVNFTVDPPWSWLAVVVLCVFYVGVTVWNRPRLNARRDQRAWEHHQDEHAADADSAPGGAP